MHINKYERWWMTFGLAMLGIFLAIIFYAAAADNINPPADLKSIDPTRVAQTPPFDRPGLRKNDDGSYDAYYVAQIFSFTPNVLRVPRGAKVTFYVTSPDVVHGFYIAKTDVNLMVIPGWVNSASHTFTHKGNYLLICHEYCGLGHQNMFARIEVH